MQLYGNAEDPLPEAARWAIQNGAQLIDINMGCPVDKVAKKNGGSLLLRDCASTLGLVEKVLAAVESESNGAVPLTAKIRLGWDDDSIVGPTLARNLERVGVSAVTVHGRTTAQKFSGSANWRAIGEVVAAVKDIPIIGNGDVQDPQDVCELMRVSGCSGVMIGRASLRTPWIFAHAKQLLDTNTAANEPSFNDKCHVILRHIDLLEELTDPAYGLRTMRQKISRYGKTMGHVKSMKEAIRTAADFDTMRQAIRPWIQPHRDSVSALVQREYHLQD
jgi:nifR3 family TIM-barrel protein